MRTVTIYTDGSVATNPGIGGWAAVLIDEKTLKEKEISGTHLEETTNNRMEMTAAIEALKSLTCKCKVVIHTDSQYLCKPFLVLFWFYFPISN